MPRRFLFTLFPLVLEISSCSLLEPGRLSGFEAALPDQFSLYEPAPADLANAWWERFNSKELNHLVEEALQNSPTLAQTWYRLDQANALAIKSGAARLPSGQFEARASRRKALNSDTDVESYQIGLPVAYEVDLWGRIHSQTQAAKLDREASREQVSVAANTLAAQVVLRWSSLIAQRLQTGVIRDQLEVNQTLLELIALRFRRSLSTALDVLQQRQTTAAAAALVPLAERSEQTLKNELAALLGRTGLNRQMVNQDQLPQIEPLPAVGIPSDLLANRPDIRLAGRQLHAADWRVAAARADRLPALRLTASGNASADHFPDLFANWFANLAGSIAGPIFDGRQRRAEVARTYAVVQERLMAYHATVVNAIKEVENALVSEQKQHDYVGALDLRLDAAAQAYAESLSRYRSGLIEYTTVLTQLNTLQGLERGVISAQAGLIGYRIDLYRALGGDWTAKLEPPEGG